MWIVVVVIHPCQPPLCFYMHNNTYFTGNKIRAVAGKFREVARDISIGKKVLPNATSSELQVCLPILQMTHPDIGPFCPELPPVPPVEALVDGSLHQAPAHRGSSSAVLMDAPQPLHQLQTTCRSNSSMSLAGSSETHAPDEIVSPMTDEWKRPRLDDDCFFKKNIYTCVCRIWLLLWPALLARMVRQHHHDTVAFHNYTFVVLKIAHNYN